MNPYKVLGVRPNASRDEIEEAYREMIDRYNEEYSDYPMEFRSNETLGEINAAFNSLINDVKYKEIRDLIESEQFVAAETELNLISDKNNPEWNYLRGFIMLKKGWIQSGVTHLKAAAKLNPSNEEYQETLVILSRKLDEIKTNYARMAAARSSAQNNNNSMDLCGGSPGGAMGGANNMNMCNSMPPAGGGMGGNPLGGAMGGNPLAGAMGGNPLAGAMGGNPLGGAMGGNQSGGNMANNPLAGLMGGSPMGGNPLQNMLFQNLMSPNNMNMCGGGGPGGGMC